MSLSFTERILRHIEDWAYALTMDEDPDALVEELAEQGLPELQIEQIVHLAEVAADFAAAVEAGDCRPADAVAALTQAGFDPALADAILQAACRGVTRAIDEVDAEDEDA